MLRGKNIVITGTIQGIGKATLEYFANNGANVWACALSQNDEFEQFCADLSTKNNVWIKPLYFDLTNTDDVKRVVKEIMSQKISIDALINIAGMTKDAIFQMVTNEDIRKIFDVNFFSQMYFTQLISKIMLRNNTSKSSIVFTSSISALDGCYGQLSYASSKAALIGATKTLSKELASKGIRVNAIAPGVIDTDMNKIVPEQILNDKLKTCSLSRMGTSEEVASVLAFLASDLSKHITGQIIRIDGGMK